MLLKKAFFLVNKIYQARGIKEALWFLMGSIIGVVSLGTASYFVYENDFEKAVVDVCSEQNKINEEENIDLDEFTDYDIT